MDAVEVERLIEDAMMEVAAAGDDTVLLSQEQSAEFYEGVAQECSARARLIRSEMG